MDPRDVAVLVTGATGFIAMHIIRQLQEAGYRVRGTVRSLCEGKVAALRGLCPSAWHPVELIVADLDRREGWDAAVTGCRYVIHVASPNPAYPVRAEEQLVRLAVEGTRNVLRACARIEGTVKRVVLTSSIAAITELSSSVRYSFTENDWADVTKVDAHAKSKTLAEQAAWDFVDLGRNEHMFELAVINPGMVLGPLITDTSGSVSVELMRKIVSGEMSPVPKMSIPCVDVRDVARCHIEALTSLKAAGHRHIVIEGNHSLKEIAATVAEHFKSEGYHPSTREIPNFMLKFFGIFVKDIRKVIPNLGKVLKFDNSRMTDVLAVRPRDFSQSVIDMCQSLISRGMVTKPAERKSGRYCHMEVSSTD